MRIKNRHIQKLFIITLALIPGFAFSENCSFVAKVVSIEGLVESKAGNESVWQPASLEQQYCSGDALRTDHNSRAAVRIVNDTLLRLDSGTTVTFTEVATKERSWLDILKGAVHFISRVPRSLEVTTPAVNAAIEGTEFVVTVSDTATDVTVYEGLVVAANSAGSVKLAANQTGRAETGQAPVRVEVARPRDAVAWALYYPPLAEQPGVADTLAQQTISALVQNQIDEAVSLAQQAIAADPQSAAAHMAQSYVNQAQFDINAALASSQKAAELAPQSALTLARLAEVWLMTGETQAARQVAAQAVELDPKLSLTQSTLGFASLREINLDAASAAFEKAILLDSAAPLPRLGLGLVKIRQGELQAGREDIETAALLDPNNALLRSYMGKAYYEEKRSGLASEQFAMAKDLDPNDPTAWFYDSILLQSENRPVEALQAQQQAIELNDNRGIYRSRQLLDNDNAARGVALARIYNDLYFEQLASIQATNALTRDPGNHSAHRLLADSYAGVTNLDAARQSELLQSKLTQPLNLDPLQPQLSNSNLGLLDGNGPGDLSYNEYNPLFTQNGMALQLDAAVAEQNTWSNDAIVAGLFNNFAFSLGQYHTETDGFRPNADYEQDIYNAFAQFAFSENTSFQIEISKDEEVKGDLTQRLAPDLVRMPNMRINNDIDTLRLGLNQRLPGKKQLLLSSIKRDQDFESIDSSPGSITTARADRKISIHDAQLNGTLNNHFWLTGFSYHKKDTEGALELDFSPLPCFFPSCVFPSAEEASQTRLYGYFHYQPDPALSLISGLTLIKEESEDGGDVEKAYPKLGLHWQTKDDNIIRLAAFRSRASVIAASMYETLEPTQIVGFNQIQDNLDLTDSWNYAAGYNHQFSKTLSSGINLVYRDLETPISVTDASTFPPSQSIQTIEYNDTTAGLWLNWALSNKIAMGVNYSFNDYDFEKGLVAAEATGTFAPDNVLELTTHVLPLSISYFHTSGFSTNLTASYYDQKGKFINSFSEVQNGEDQGLITDLTFNYRLPKRLGSVSFGVKNLFDEKLLFEDRNSYDSSSATRTASPSEFSEEQLLFGTVSINFR